MTENVYIDTRDNNVYRYKKIGNQIWMLDNFKFKPPTGFWDIGNIVNDEKYSKKYGYLYQYDEIKNYIPKGWKIPTFNDWLILYKNLGNNLADFSQSLIINNEIGFNTNFGGFINYQNNKYTLSQYKEGVMFMTQTFNKNLLQVVAIMDIMLSARYENIDFSKINANEKSINQSGKTLNEIRDLTLNFCAFHVNKLNGMYIKLIKDTSIPIPKVITNTSELKSNFDVVQARKYLDQKKYDLAIDLYEKYLKTNPTDYTNWFNLGVAYRESGNLEKEINCNFKAISINSQFKPALANLGYSHYIKKDFKSAIFYWNKLIEIAPKEAYREMCNIAILFHKEGDYKNAIKYYELTLKYNPDYKPALTNLKWAKQNKWV
jgi:uncharacterized protein (TIGR02145 family)